MATVDEIVQETIKDIIDREPMIMRSKGEIKVRGYFTKPKPYYEEGQYLCEYRDFVKFPRALSVRKFVDKFVEDNKYILEEQWQQISKG